MPESVLRKQFREDIIDKLKARSYESLSEDIVAAILMERIDDRVFGDLKQIIQVGPYRTSAFRTFKAFINALDNAAFSISRKDVLRLVGKHNTSNAIREVNALIERVANPKTRKEKFKLYQSEMSNSAFAGKQRIKDVIAEYAATVKTGMAELHAKMTALSTGGVFKTILLFLSSIMNVLGDNEVLVGVIPLGGLGIGSPVSVQSIEVAHSNEIVKFRAVGSIFLAHQLGGQDSVKVSGMLSGNLRQFFLVALWMLTLASQGYLEAFDLGSQVDNNDPDNPGGFNIQQNPGMFRDGGPGKVTPLAKIDGIAVERPSYQKHITFPVVTTHEIIPNCYIETFSFEETIDNEIDTITYDLLLRTYLEPEEFISDQVNGLYMAKQRTKTAHVLRFFLNFGWRLLKYKKETMNLDTSSWKTSNYYDVDALDIGFAFGLALLGGKGGGL